MEQKKTLWIIASVGIFLLVVLGAAGLMSSFSSKNSAPSIASVFPVDKGSANENKNGWTAPQEERRDAPELSLPPETKTKDLIVLADNANVYEMQKKEPSNTTTIDLNALKQELLNESQPQNINITVNIPEAKSEVSVSKDDSAAKKSESKISSQTQNAAADKKAKTTSTAVSKPVTKKVEKAPVKEVKPQAKKTQHWVQVASYSNKKGAEEARSILDENKIPADIFTYKDNKDNLFYRVRVGPYTTKSEAEYWRTRIENIKEFAKAKSYVTSTIN